MVEHVPDKNGVEGSIPSTPTDCFKSHFNKFNFVIFKKLKIFLFFLFLVGVFVVLFLAKDKLKDNSTNLQERLKVEIREVVAEVPLLEEEDFFEEQEDVSSNSAEVEEVVEEIVPLLVEEDSPEDQEEGSSFLPSDLPSFNSLDIIDKEVSWGYKKVETNRFIDTIIIHTSYDALGVDPYSVEGIIEEYRIYGVSAHYLIDRQGNIFRLVKEKDIAYHAGQGTMPDGRTAINNFSIGIELVNLEDGELNEIQYEQLIELIKSINSRFEIKNILGHNQIAPGRKTDPWNFDWLKFNEKLRSVGFLE